MTKLLHGPSSDTLRRYRWHALDLPDLFTMAPGRTTLLGRAEQSHGKLANGHGGVFLPKDRGHATDLLDILPMAFERAN